MKSVKAVIFFFFLTSFAFSTEVENYICNAPLVVALPSMEVFNKDFELLLKRFYGKNHLQVMQEYSLQVKSSIGINIFDNSSLEKIGIDVTKPVVFVHISNETGYLLIPVTSNTKLKNFMDKQFGNSLNYKFLKSYVAISKDTALLKKIGGKDNILTNSAFNLSKNKLNFKWKDYFVWVEGKYISEITSSQGITFNIKLPYSFSALSFGFSDYKLILNGYSGIISKDQEDYIKRIRFFNAREKINLLDYIDKHPAVVMVMNLNFLLLYDYLKTIDTVDILGLKSFSSEMKDVYNIDFEKELLSNADGRFRMVVNSFDLNKNYYVVYGTLGIMDKMVAERFINNLNQAIIRKGEKVYSFEMFTRPFYRCSFSKFSLYYGLVENDLIFSTDKDVLTNVVIRMFKKEGGELTNYPPFISNANLHLDPGVFSYVDVQSFLSEVKAEVQLQREFFMDLKEINLLMRPDSDDHPSGWNYTIEVIWNNAR